VKIFLSVAAGIQRQAAKPQSEFFYYETRKPGISEKISWLPGFIMWHCFWPRLCAFASLREKFFAWWLTARSGRPQGPGQKANEGK
jgi:hypothetical protein